MLMVYAPRAEVARLLASRRRPQALQHPPGTRGVTSQTCQSSADQCDAVLRAATFGDDADTTAAGYSLWPSGRVVVCDPDASTAVGFIG